MATFYVATHTADWNVHNLQLAHGRKGGRGPVRPDLLRQVPAAGRRRRVRPPAPDGQRCRCGAGQAGLHSHA